MLKGYCPHCSNGLTALQLAIIMAVASTAIGAIAGVAIKLPCEGMAFGLLHAVVPAAFILDEAYP